MELFGFNFFASLEDLSLGQSVLQVMPFVQSPVKELSLGHANAAVGDSEGLGLGITPA